MSELTSGAERSAGVIQRLGQRANRLADWLTAPTEWRFPELDGPDLSIEVIPGQHEAMKLLDDHSIAEIFALEDDERLPIFDIPGTD